MSTLAIPPSNVKFISIDYSGTIASKRHLYSPPTYSDLRQHGQTCYKSTHTYPFSSYHLPSSKIAKGITPIVIPTHASLQRRILRIPRHQLHIRLHARTTTLPQTPLLALLRSRRRRQAPHHSSYRLLWVHIPRPPYTNSKLRLVPWDGTV